MLLSGMSARCIAYWHLWCQPGRLRYRGIEEYVLYLAAKELQMANIGEAQVQAKNDDVHYRGAAEGVIFRCFMRNGRVRYETYRGVERTHPSECPLRGVSFR